MDFLQSILENSSIPLVTAFVLGLLTAISPCPLATNITAIGFISKDMKSQHTVFISGLFYTLGRIITYAALGFILIPIIRQGANFFAIQKAISKYGEMLLAPTLILIGLFMLFGSKLNLPNFGFKGPSSRGLKQKGWLGALLLGVLFSLAFCPSSGVFFFGMLIPMASTASTGYLMPIIFAIATGLPVIIVAWILAYSISGLGKFYNSMQAFQKWFSKLVAILFIVVGVYYAIMFYL